MVPRLGCEPQAPSSLRSPLTDAPENNCPRGVLTSALTLTITIIISHMMRDRRLERPLRNPGLNVHPQSPVCVCACMYVCPHHFTDGCSGSPFYKDCCLSISSSSLSPPASLPPSLPRPSLVLLFIHLSLVSVLKPQKFWFWYLCCSCSSCCSLSCVWRRWWPCCPH